MILRRTRANPSLIRRAAGSRQVQVGAGAATALALVFTTAGQTATRWAVRWAPKPVRDGVDRLHGRVNRSMAGAAARLNRLAARAMAMEDDQPGASLDDELVSTPDPLTNPTGFSQNSGGGQAKPSKMTEATPATLTARAGSHPGPGTGSKD